MKTSIGVASILGLMVSFASAIAEEDDEAASQRAQLEIEFRELLSGATLEGYFTDSSAPEQSPPQRDRYTIQSLKKLGGDLWLFTARIQYGERDMTVPIPLKVLWAGDTPVITLTNFAIPPLGAFSARVLFYRGEYAGTWSGGDHGGKLYGTVIPAEPTSTPFEAPTTTNWPQFRGPSALGIADGHPLPVEWDVESGEGVKWTTEIPGLSHSSPVVWGDMIFVTSAIKEEGDDAELKVGLYGSIESVPDDSEHSMRLYCLDKNDGTMLWEHEAWRGVPKIKRHPKSSHAACSPVTDGEHVVAFFASEGMYCYNLDGILLWQKDLGVLDAGFYMLPDAQWGSASSPIIHDGRLIVQCDVQEGSFIAAFDVDTGDEIWRTERSDVPTWSTPTVHVGKDQTQVICNGFHEAAGYDFETGERIWSLDGGGDIPVPTPIVAHDLIYLTNAHGSLAPIYAIRTNATGRISTDPEESIFMEWSHPRRGIYMQTPIAYGDLVYFCNDAGVVTSYDAKTGAQVYRQRLGSGGAGFSASGVAGDGKLYFTSEQGTCFAVKAGHDFEVLGFNDLNETCMATPAISDGTLFFRTRSHLVAVSNRD